MVRVVWVHLLLCLPLALPAPGPAPQESKQYKTIESSDAHDVLHLVRQMAGNVTEQEMAAMRAVMTLNRTNGVERRNYARINDHVVARVVWETINFNKDDHLDLTEFLRLSTDGGVGFMEEMQDAINYYDTDGDGSISFAEFLVLLHQPLKEGKHVTRGQRPGTTNTNSLAGRLQGGGHEEVTEVVARTEREVDFSYTDWDQGLLQVDRHGAEDADMEAEGIENLENNREEFPNVFDSKGTKIPRTAKTTVLPESNLLSYGSILAEVTTNTDFEHSGETKRDDGFEEKEVGGLYINDRQLNTTKEEGGGLKANMEDNDYNTLATGHPTEYKGANRAQMHIVDKFGDEESIEVRPNIDENKQRLGEGHEHTNEKEDRDEEEPMEDNYKETDLKIMRETHVHTSEQEFTKEENSSQIEHNATNEQVSRRLHVDTDTVTVEKALNTEDGNEGKDDRDTMVKSNEQGTGSQQLHIDKAQAVTSEKTAELTTLKTTVADMKIAEKQNRKFKGNPDETLDEDYVESSLKKQESKEEYTAQQYNTDADDIGLSESTTEGKVKETVELEESQQNLDFLAQYNSHAEYNAKLDYYDYPLDNYDEIVIDTTPGNPILEPLMFDEKSQAETEENKNNDDRTEQGSTETGGSGSGSSETGTESAWSDDEYEKDVIEEDENIEEEYNFEYNTKDKAISESATEGKVNEMELEEGQQNIEFLAEVNSQAEYNYQFDYHDYPLPHYSLTNDVSYDRDTAPGHASSSPLIEESETNNEKIQVVNEDISLWSREHKVTNSVDAFPHGNETFPENSQNHAVKETRKFLEDIQSSWPEIDFEADGEEYEYDYETKKPVIETLTKLSVASSNPLLERKSDTQNDGDTNKINWNDIEVEDIENPGEVMKEARQLFHGDLPGPTKLRLVTSTSTWAALAWEAPILPHPIVLHHYKALCFKPEFELHHDEATTEGTETELVVGGLEMGTMYICEVKGETSLGPTLWSQEIMFYPLPSALRQLKATVDKLAMQSAHCAYQEKWTEAESTITFTSLPLSHGLGALDVSSGEWVAGVAGQYMVTWDLYSHLFRGEAIMVRLYRRRRGRPEESHSHRHYSKFGVTTGLTEYDNIREQGGRSKITSVEEGEALFLKAGTFTGEAFRINFCIHLLYAH